MITSGVSDYKKGESAKTFFYYLKASAFYIALEIVLSISLIDSSPNRYNQRYSFSFGDYWLDLFLTD